MKMNILIALAPLLACLALAPATAQESVADRLKP